MALRERGIDEVVLHTGQHYDRRALAGLLRGAGAGGAALPLDLRTADTEAMRQAIEGPLREERPDWVLVYGDTNSTLAGALAATEQACRWHTSRPGCAAATSRCRRSATGSRPTGWPQLLLAPDERSREQLAAEGVPGRRRGGRRRDGGRCAPARARSRASARTLLEQLGLEPAHTSCHHPPRGERRASRGSGRIVEGLGRLEEPVVFPVHPRTRAAIERAGLELGPHVASARRSATSTSRRSPRRRA